jgi:CubicO group peptidase (beta-lactamase class C family)
VGLDPAAGLGPIASWPGSHRAAGWRRRDGTEARSGDEQHEFRLASVTKVLTAMAVLVAVEEEVIALDEPAGPPGSTVRLLLCHASGLPFEGTVPIAAPGERRIYGNPAFEALAALVEARAAVPFADYLHEAVCAPLGMTSTTLRGSAAHGARSTLSDLLLLVGELLSPARVLAPETLASATEAQLPELDGVLPGFGTQRPNPWGLGFELHGTKSPHWMPPEASPSTFGHFGQSGTFLWVEPTAGVACVALCDAPFGQWALDAWPRLGSAVLSAAAG